MADIIQDSVDVECFIGDDEWEIIEAEIVLTKNTTPNYVKMLITPSPGTPVPATPQERGQMGSLQSAEDSLTRAGLLGNEFTLDVYTDLRPNVQGQPETRLFTGNVANMTPTGRYTFEAIANDRTQEPFHTSDSSSGGGIQNKKISTGKALNVSFDEEDEYNGIRVSELVNNVCDEMNISEENRNPFILSDGGTTIGETYYGVSVIQGIDARIIFDSWYITIDEALTAATERSNSHWWFDRYGNFNFGALVPGDDVTSYEARYITDSSAGMTTPPYRSVRVIGDGVVSEDGWSRSSLLNERSYSTEGNVYIEEDDAQLAEPTFTYRNMEITTAQEADNVKQQLVDKLKSQRGSGTVTLVGFPELYPNDVIEMPSTEKQPMGGARYGIHTVTHRLNGDDGFITKVEVEGLGFSQETLYESEGRVNALEDELTENLARERAGYTR